jgi:hypothetical protein
MDLMWFESQFLILFFNYMNILSLLSLSVTPSLMLWLLHSGRFKGKATIRPSKNRHFYSSYLVEDNYIFLSNGYKHHTIRDLRHTAHSLMLPIASNACFESYQHKSDTLE